MAKRLVPDQYTMKGLVKGNLKPAHILGFIASVKLPMY